MECTLIAEVGCNHKGDLDIARRFIDVARSFCNVTHVKFQKRNVRELLTPDQYNSPHPEPHQSYGRTYGEHREFLEFTIEQHAELKQYCDARQMVYACSVWDLTSAKQIIDLNPACLKIPSAVNTHWELIDHVCRTYRGPVHISLGMTTRVEERALVDLLRARSRIQDVVLYACTSGYPIQAEEACLLEIRRLLADYGSEVLAIGYSGHHNGIALDMGAVTLGAAFLERHFTLNRTWKGTDHAASLEPDGLRRLRRNVDALTAALTYKTPEILPIEAEQRAKLKTVSPSLEPFV